MDSNMHQLVANESDLRDGSRFSKVFSFWLRFRCKVSKKQGKRPKWLKIHLVF